MKGRMAVLVTMMMTLAGATLVMLPEGALADVSHADAIALVEGNTFTVQLKWTYETSEGLEIRLYHNDGLEKTASTMWGDPGRNDVGSIYTTPLKAGTYKVVLWSNTYSKEVYSKSWEVPRLNISLSVAPGTGQLGTTFVATTTFSINAAALDMVRFSGTLELQAGPSVFRTAVGGTLYADHYYTYNGKTEYTIEPVFVTTGFTFPAAGSYVVTARYTDSVTNTTALSGTLVMEDQFQSQIAKLGAELNDTRTALCETGRELDAARADLQAARDQLSSTGSKLNETDKRLADTKKDLNAKIDASSGLAYAGIAAGVVGVVFGLVGMMLARRKNAAPPAAPPPPATHSPPPVQAQPVQPPPPVQAPAPVPYQPAPQPLPPPPPAPVPYQQAPQPVPPPQAAAPAPYQPAPQSVPPPQAAALAPYQPAPQSVPPPQAAALAPYQPAPQPVQPPQPASAPLPAPQPAQPAPEAQPAAPNCARCGAPMPAGMRFCGNCGAAR
ncbi:MAG: hypothetical protein FJ149_06220 [Euryarchaeota archaeon]|nr:hypothetical protein [Euryarchaeota archaeon]